MSTQNAIRERRTLDVINRILGRSYELVSYSSKYKHDGEEPTTGAKLEIKSCKKGNSWVLHGKDLLTEKAWAFGVWVNRSKDPNVVYEELDHLIYIPVELNSKVLDFIRPKFGQYLATKPKNDGLAFTEAQLKQLFTKTEATKIIYIKLNNEKNI